VSSLAAPPRPRLRAAGQALAVSRPGPDGLLTAGLAAILCAIAFSADGGLRLGRITPTELGLVLGGGLVAAAGALAAPARGRLYGLAPILLLFAFAALSALSVLWAVDPAQAWFEANREVSYAFCFLAAAACAHLAPERWNAVLGGITVFGVVVSAYALATRVLPGALSADEVYARLREPYGYWNAVGLTGALAVPGLLWLGARRTGHQALNAVALPALALCLVCVLLSYSRGALLAAAAGVALWFAVVPLRLRATAVLVPSLAGALFVVLWAFGRPALSEDRVPLALREEAGAELGAVLAGTGLVLLLAGLAIGFALASRPPRPGTRRAVGAALLVALALVPVGVVGALALSDRGLGGTVSDSWRSLTDPEASSPANDPARLTETGSVRARYWREAWAVFRDEPVLGVGAGGYAIARPRYREDDLAVRHAHGHVVQVLADLGLVGAGVTLLLLLAWLACAARAVGLRPRERRTRWSAERVGLASLLAVVVVFGVHSLVDWTWFIPGTAVPALVAAGWLAGRGPLGAGRNAAPAAYATPLRARLAAGLRSPARANGAFAAIALALVAAWAVWQPLRAEQAGQDALAALERGDLTAARANVAAARERNPLSVEPLFERAVVETRAGDLDAARAALAEAVRLQPDNPATWLQLAEFELFTLRRPEVALAAVRPALFLDPRSDPAIEVFLQARRETTAPPPGAQAAPTEP
jgi:O-antigen ligase